MFHRRHLIEALVRLGIVGLLLFNAIIPIAKVSANEAPSKDLSNRTHGVRTLPVQFPSYYHPSNEIFTLTKTSSLPDQPNPQKPPKSPIEFTVTANPGIVSANGEIKLDVLIRNNSKTDLSNLTFFDKLENRYSYSQGLFGIFNPLKYDSQKKMLSLYIGTLKVGGEFFFFYLVHK